MIAYARDSSVRSTGVTSLALAFTGATGAGSLIVVGVIPESLTASVTSITDTQGNTYRFVRRQTFSGSYSMEVWYAYNTAGGACTVTVNLSLAANVDCSIAEYTGAATRSDPLDTSNGADNAGASASLGLTTSVPNTLLYGLIGSPNSSPSAGAGCTLRSNFDTGRQIYWAPEDSSGTANTAGVNAIAFVNSTAQNGFIGVAFKPTPASSAPAAPSAPVGRTTPSARTKGGLTLDLPSNAPADAQLIDLLNLRLKTITEELARLGGARGPVKLLDDLDMDGHSVIHMGNPVGLGDGMSREAADRRYLTAAAALKTSAAAAANPNKAAAATTKRQIELSAPGTLGIGSSLAPLVQLDEARTASGVVLLVKGAPAGADLQASINLAGVRWALGVIKNGATSGTLTGSGLAQIPADTLITLDLIGVGTTFPGSDLSVLIRLA